jgi:hypothetical protein
MNLFFSMAIATSAVWAWAYFSGTVNKLIDAGGSSALLYLPFWAVSGYGRWALMLINMLLFVAFLGVPIACFVKLPFLTALGAIACGMFGGGIIIFLVSSISSNLMAKYVFSGLIVLALGIYFALRGEF